jgi:hypothetical protein
MWQSWLDAIGERVKSVAGVTTEIIQPNDLSNHAPQLRIKWDGLALGITGKEVEDLLGKGRPRILVGGSSGVRPDAMASSLTIMPYMMQPDDHKIAAQAIHALLSKPLKMGAPVRPSGEPSSIAGNWDVKIDFSLGSAKHRLTIIQNGASLTGFHEGETVSGDVRGSVIGNQARFRSRHAIQGTSIGYDFVGTVEGGQMSGDVAMGEYGVAKWSARKRG